MNAALIGSIIYNYYYKNEDDKMTDHKFTDDELEMTLHICSHYAGNCSDYCPLRHDDECVQTMARHALALINRQKVEIEALKIANEKMYSANKEQEAEIERLNTVHAEMNESLRLASEANKDMQAEIEKLKGQKRALVLFWREENKKLKTAKSEAIKEFAERLKANMSNIARMEYGGNIYFCVGYDLIDTLVKEMTEEQK